MPFDKYLDFLREEHVEAKQNDLLNKKIRSISQTKIGKEIGVSASSKLENLPFTSYPFYQRFFETPVQEAFTHPLDEYLRVMTTGSMGRPKWYLIPKIAILEDTANTILADIAACSHDGKEVTAKEGDLIYANLAPKPFFTGYASDYFHDAYSDMIRIIPSTQDMPFPEKIELFIKNYEKIDIALLPLPILWDVIYARVRKPTKLKGYITLDLAMSRFREKMLETFGVVPSSIYASTETGLAAIPSPQHFSGIILDWRIGSFEFLPENRTIEKEVSTHPASETIPINEVKTGETYQLVATPFRNDLVRYVMMDLLECIAKGDDCIGTDLPVFRFVGRVGGIISLHNFTLIDEDEIVTALKEAGIRYVDFTIRHHIEGTHETMVMYLEPLDQTTADEIRNLLNEQLSTMDRSYADIQKFFGHVPLKVILFPRGTFARYQLQRTGIVKPERIGMKEENFRTLMEISKSQDQ